MPNKQIKQTDKNYQSNQSHKKSVLLAGGGSSHQEAANAMMVLADLHDAQFGPMDTTSGTGFSDFTVRTGYDGLR